MFMSSGKARTNLSTAMTNQPLLFNGKLCFNRVKKLYNYKDKLLWIDCTLFEISINTRLQQSSTTLEAFISYIKPIIQLSKQQAKKRDKQSTTPINKHFNPIHNNILSITSPQIPTG